MPTATRHRNSGLIRRLADDPTGFSFFQAHRLLRLLTAAPARRFPASRYLPIKYRTHLSLDFPTCEVQDATVPQDIASVGDEPPASVEIVVNFMGLVGPSGELPRHYTETLILERQLQRTDAAHQFLDLFNHRLIALFAEAWEKYRFFVPYERGDQRGFTRNLLDLVGMGTSGLFGRVAHGGPSDKLPDFQILAYYGGIGAQRPHNAANLRAMLADYFGAPVMVEEFVGARGFIPVDQRSTVGRANSSLGETLVAGAAFWSRQSKCRVVIGPLPLEKYLEFLPDGEAYPALGALASWYVGATLSIEVQLLLKRDEVPEPELEAKRTLRLGQSFWLKTRAFECDPRGAALQIQ